MCGICGSLSFNDGDFQINEPFISTMRDTMAHRGPDGAGVWISKDFRVGLGHRRLSIIDLSISANQPMSNDDETIWVVFNGEIYNHAELRHNLSLSGKRKYKWKTNHSDTEVIIHAFEEWGIDCIHKFRGMFAFALWDSREKNLWLVRDRIGVKPLYYSIHNQHINFASEIKALLVDKQQHRVVNEEAFFHYLSFLTTPAPMTLFDGIQKIPGGHWLKISCDGKLQLHQYWDVLDFAFPRHFSTERELFSEVLHELDTAVKLRKISDVPVGVFLSGGLDSSTNAALFSKDENLPVKTFTIGYDGDYTSYKNEMQYAKLMAKYVNAEYHEMLLNVDHLIDFLPKMVRLQDEPIADPVCVPVYYVSKLARDHGVKVCQVGEGADELFWGYPFWKTYLNLQAWDDIPVPRMSKNALLHLLKCAGKGNSIYYEWLRRGASGKPIFWSGAEAFTDTQKKTLLSHDLNAKFSGFTSWEALSPIREKFMNTAWEKSHLNWMTYSDLKLRLPELLLMRVDKMSMGVSLECRVPFLDHKFVELSMSIPQAMKTKNGESKYILKNAVKNIIPTELIYRKKQGFGVPIYEWLFDKLGNKIRQELTTFCDKTDFLNKNEVLNLLNNNFGAHTWYLLNFALWWKEFIE